MKKNVKHFCDEKKGFTVLFAVLISSIILAIGASIASLTLKDLVFATSGRESQFAFYAADSGLECAKYWDKKENSFALVPTESYPTSRTITCNGETLQSGSGMSFSLPGSSVTTTIIGARNTGDGIGTSVFVVNFLNNSDESERLPYCAIVSVTKTSNSEGYDDTTIQSRGYNNCKPGEPAQKIVERGLEVSY